MQGQDCVTAFPHPRAGSLTGGTALDGAIGPEAPLQGCEGRQGMGPGDRKCRAGWQNGKCGRREKRGTLGSRAPQGSGKPESCPSPGNRPAPEPGPRCRPPRARGWGGEQPPSQLPGPALLTAGVRLRGPWGSRRAQPPPPPPAAQQPHQDQGQRQAQQRGGAEEQRGQRQRRLGLRRNPRAHRLLRLQRRPGRQAAAGPRCWGKRRRGRAGGGGKRRRGRGRVGGRRGWAGRRERAGRVDRGRGRQGAVRATWGPQAPRQAPCLEPPPSNGPPRPFPP